MTTKYPHLIVIAGPNGAGKSTTAPFLLKGTLHVTEFVNADLIAQGLSAFKPEMTAFHAGRIMLERIHYLAKKRVNFSFETTLASKTFAPWITELCKTGYAFILYFSGCQVKNLPLTGWLRGFVWADIMYRKIPYDVVIMLDF